VAVPTKCVRTPAFELALRPLHRQSVEERQAVMVACFSMTSAWDKRGRVILAEDFYSSRHKVIFQAIGG